MKKLNEAFPYETPARHFATFDAIILDPNERVINIENLRKLFDKFEETLCDLGFTLNDYNGFLRKDWERILEELGL